MFSTEHVESFGTQQTQDGDGRKEYQHDNDLILNDLILNIGFSQGFLNEQEGLGSSKA
jgi:hypothetical protein